MTMWTEMKRPVVLLSAVITLFWVMQAVAGNFAIVNNNTGAGTAEDTITSRVRVPDSAGQVTTADSFYVWVFYPTGALAYSSGYIESAAEITGHTQAGRTVYTWTESVADVDGTPRVGTYTGDLCAIDTTLGLEGWSSFSFVLEPTLAQRTAIGDTIGRSAALATWSTSIDAWNDTLMMWLGYVTGAMSRSDFAGAEDTVWIINGNDTLGKVIYYHPGGSPGDPPDSTKTEDP